MKNLLFVMAFMLFGFMGLAQDGGSCSCKGSSSCQVACPNGKSPECRSTLFGGCKCKCVDDGPINLEQAKLYDLNSDLEDILELKIVLEKLKNKKLIAELDEVIQFYEDNLRNNNFNQDFELSEDGLAYEFEDKETRDFYRELWTRKKVFHLLTDKQKGYFSQEHHLEDQKVLNSSDGSVVSYDNHAPDLYLNYKEKTWSQLTDTKNLIIQDELAKPLWKNDRNASNVPQFFGFKTMKAEINDGSGMIITAYYTPEIPISAGPEKYYGLPGLILYLEMRLEEDDPESAIVANIWQAKLLEEVKQSIPSLKIKRKTKFMTEMEYQDLLEANMQKQQEYNSSGVEKID